MVFVDGQNLYNACRRAFGHPLCHPHLLAEHLVGPRKLVATRFYTGRPDPNILSEVHKVRNLDRRLAAMQKLGVLPRTRQLRYHWDWGHREPLPRARRDSEPQVVMLKPWQRPQEKGVDLLLAMDVLAFLLTGACDVAIVVSLDRDLCEIPTALSHLGDLRPASYRLEAAVPVETVPSQKRIQGFHYTHHIDPGLFSVIRDDTDYTASEADWSPPRLPADLAEARSLGRLPFRALNPSSLQDLKDHFDRGGH